MAVGLGPRVSRREFVVTSAAAAAGAALPAFGQTRNLATLTLKQASELLRRRTCRRWSSPRRAWRASIDTIARSTRSSPSRASRRLRQRARWRASSGAAAARAAPRHPDRAQGQHRHGRSPDDRRQRRLQGSRAHRRRGSCRPVEEGRRRSARQAESARVRARRNVRRHLLRARSTTRGRSTASRAGHPAARPPPSLPTCVSERSALIPAGPSAFPRRSAALSDSSPRTAASALAAWFPWRGRSTMSGRCARRSRMRR